MRMENKFKFDNTEYDFLMEDLTDLYEDKYKLDNENEDCEIEDENYETETNFNEDTLFDVVNNCKKKNSFVRWNCLSISEQNKYVLSAQNGDKESLTIILNGVSNYIRKKVFWVAHVNSIDADDLYQEGVLGVLDALKRFDANSEYKFLTYAAFYIKNYINKYIKKQGLIIRVPTHLMDKYFRVRSNFHYLKSKEDFFNILERENLSLADYYNIYNIKNILSLDYVYQYGNHSASDLENISIMDTLVDEKADIYSNFTKNEMKKALRGVLETLSEKEKFVLRMRNGFVDGKRYTLEEVGNSLGVTRERIRQIEKNAMRKVKFQVRKYGINSAEDYFA